MNVQMPVLEAVLSGAEDATTDYPFGVSYFSVQKKDAVDSYYSVSAPYSLGLMEAFETRPNGTIRLKADGVEFEYFNVVYWTFARGPNSSSIVITGSRQETNTSPQTVSLGLEFVLDERLDTLGRTVLTVVPFALTVKPGDTVVWRLVSYDVVTVSSQIGSNSKVMITMEEPAP
jgi:hypothetical protein